ncbi:MAG: cytochrome c [Gallionella sp.]|nr:cytochrome c [Gallionella sp.]
MMKIPQACLLAASLILAAQTCAADEDTRIKVDLPAMMKTHMLHSMRDHLLAVHEIQVALAKGAFDKASDIAENRIGMSSLESHNAAHMAPFMPEGMQNIGTEMHHAASRFAMTASEGDLPRSLAALSKVTEQCVACHMTYRVN